VKDSTEKPNGDQPKPSQPKDTRYLHKLDDPQERGRPSSPPGEHEISPRQPSEMQESIQPQDSGTEQSESMRDAKSGFDQPRAPEDHVKLYIVGVPIDYDQEYPKRVREFENILIRARDDSWPIYTSQPAEAFIQLNRDGWKTVEKLGISVTEIERNTSLTRFEQNMNVANQVYDLAQISEAPIILLRPGSPYLGDVPVEILRLKFLNQMSAVEILDAKSGPDLVGDLAQAELRRRDLSRQHMRGVDVFNVHEASQIQEDLLVIHALNDFYKKGFTDDERLLLNIVVEKLVELGFEDKPAYIKGPQTKGLLLTVKDLAARVDEFQGNKHYTLAILLKNK